MLINTGRYGRIYSSEFVLSPQGLGQEEEEREMDKESKAWSRRKTEAGKRKR